MINNEIDFQSVDFIAICKTHKVKELYAFGSVVNETFNEQSDIDLLADIDETDPLNRGELLLSLWSALEAFFQRKVDLLTPNSLKNPYLIESINNTKKLLYDGSKEEVLR
jgi:predicted nucleotidyltransferase